MNPATRLLLLAAASVAALGLMLPGDSFWLAPATSEQPAELTVYCAAALRAPVEEIAEGFQQECGVRLRLHYGGSNTLLSQIEVAREGDLYLAADESFLKLGQEKGLVAEITPLGRMRAVVAVPRGNPLGIASLDDLLTSRISAGNPDQTAIGRTLRSQLKTSNRWEALEHQIRQSGVFKPTVNDVANDILLGSVDAGVVWDAVARQYPGIDIVEIPELTTGSVQLGVGVLASADNRTDALRFARYLAAADRGLPVFEKNGYRPVSGEPWSERKE